MLQLPKTKRDPKETEYLCKCRPVCKSRRREWKGTIQNTSAELLLERKQLPMCFRRWPTKIYHNAPCPLLGRTVNEHYGIHKSKVVRICQAPIEDTVDTPYLRYARMAQDLGAWGAVHACCAFCACGACCACSARGYVPHDAERAARRRLDMRRFDARVKSDHRIMRIMYDKM